MQPIIMVLPGALWQLKLIQTIKSMGYRVLVVHPDDKGAAVPYADIVEYSDILDQQAVLEIARKYQVVAVMSDECDIATPTLAYVSSQLGLPTQTEAMATLYTDKSKMRDFCKLHNLPHPQYQVCANLDEALAFYCALGKKMIIKPIDANSSRGVYSITSEAELRAHFDEAMHYSHHRHAVICERYIQGAEFSVDGITFPDGQHVCLAISEKKQFSYNQNLDEILYFSYDSPEYDYNRLREIDDKFVELSKLPFGFTHAEYKYEDGEFYLIEIGARGGGAMISSHIVPALTGIDNYRLLVDMFTGKDVAMTRDDCGKPYSKVAVLQFFDTTEKGGVVKAIHGAEFMNSNPHILYWQMNFKEGDTIHRPTDGGNRIGFYVAWAENREAMKQLQAEIDRNVVIEYAE